VAAFHAEVAEPVALKTLASSAFTQWRSNVDCRIKIDAAHPSAGKWIRGARSMTSASGLEGVVVAETELSDVDGERGILTIRGHAVEDLVGRASFEDVCGLLWHGVLPSPVVRNDIAVSLARARSDAFERMPALGGALFTSDGMNALRAALAHLQDSGNPSHDRTLLTASVAVFAAAWHRVRAGEMPVAPRADLTHAADFLRMLSGEEPSPAQVTAMDAYLCCVCDHGLNASTFAARVVASTRSDMVSSIVAAIGALKGPLHGGAPGPVLDMLDAIGQPGHAHAWLEAEVAAGRRIMGMGHRVYRVRDPRATALERTASSLQASGAAPARLVLARHVEREAERLLEQRHPGRHLKANVEFYTAVLLDALGVPRTMFTPTFAASRVAGWCAHVEEEWRVGRLIRPASRYVGPVPA
jgi:citrate synthase